MEPKIKTRDQDRYREWNKKTNKQKLPGPGHQGRQVQRDHPGQAFWVWLCFPNSFPLREGGIWAPSEGASILEKAQIPWSMWKHVEINCKVMRKMEPKIEKTLNQKWKSKRWIGAARGLWETNGTTIRCQVHPPTKSERHWSQDATGFQSRFFPCVSIAWLIGWVPRFHLQSQN